MKMTKEETVKRMEENLKVAQAWAEGAEVEFRIPDTDQSRGWTGAFNPSFDPTLEYRVKPKAPREFWLNVYGGGNMAIHTNKEAASTCAGSSRIECIHLREVLACEPTEEPS